MNRVVAENVPDGLRRLYLNFLGCGIDEVGARVVEEGMPRGLSMVFHRSEIRIIVINSDVLLDSRLAAKEERLGRIMARRHLALG